MKFGVLYEHQLPRPWDGAAELTVVQESLDQVALADRLGIDAAWAVEHHFLQEYAHCSAPEVFLAACAARTERIRLGHGIVLMPPAYNPPARVAERIATLDLVSRGRVDWGVGESSSRLELEGFGIDPAERRAMSLEAVEQVTDMLVMEPYPGFQGRHVSLPPRNIVPKPVQKPHPPLWLACSNRNTIRLAARLGVGALTLAFIDADEARQWVDDFHETLARECVPIGHAVNAQVAMLTGLSCHADGEEARRRGLDGFRFFQFALAHYYAYGEHRPGRTDLWRQYVAVRDELGTEVLGGGTGCIGTPSEVARTLEGLEAAGVDQAIFIQQTGRTRHGDICESLELLATAVLPPFRDREAVRAPVRAAARAPHAEAALARKGRRRTPDRGRDLRRAGLRPAAGRFGHPPRGQPPPTGGLPAHAGDHRPHPLIAIPEGVPFIGVPASDILSQRHPQPRGCHEPWRPNSRGPDPHGPASQRAHAGGACHPERALPAPSGIRARQVEPHRILAAEFSRIVLDRLREELRGRGGLRDDE